MSCHVMWDDTSLGAHELVSYVCCICGSSQMSDCNHAMLNSIMSSTSKCAICLLYVQNPPIRSIMSSTSTCTVRWPCVPK